MSKKFKVGDLVKIVNLKLGDSYHLLDGALEQDIVGRPFEVIKTTEAGNLYNHSVRLRMIIKLIPGSVIHNVYKDDPFEWWFCDAALELWDSFPYRSNVKIKSRGAL